MRREDVDTLSRENMKNLHEIMQSFRFSNVCYWSYLTRTCLEIVLSIGTLVFGQPIQLPPPSPPIPIRSLLFFKNSNVKTEVYGLAIPTTY